MSVIALALAFDIPLAPRDKLVLLALADYYNDEQRQAWMSQRRLAAKTGYTRVTIGAALRSLEEMGLISTEQRWRRDGSRSTKAYRLTFVPGYEAEDAKQVGHHAKSVDMPHAKSVSNHADEIGNMNAYRTLSNEQRERETRAREKSKEPKKRKSLAHDFDPATVAIPDSFDRERFVDFCASRLKLKSPMTDLALKRFIGKHGERSRAELDGMFDAAIVAGWKDLYPPRAARPSKPVATAADYSAPVNVEDLLGGPL